MAIYEPRYNDRGLLASEDLVLGTTRTTVFDELVYDAKGQRQAIRHGNGTRTRYTYDPDTFRLVQLRTTRPGYDPAFPSAVAQFRDANVVQNLFYTYDAAGNVTEIYDDAFRPAFFANQQIDAVARYTYDALYRLIAATGREHVGALLPGAVEPSPLATGFPVPAGDPADQRNYTERYGYDAVGNLVQVAHAATTGWTRNYAYDDHSNRLRQTWSGTDTLNATTYAHDTHGNILAFGSALVWDHRDLVQVLDRGGGGRVYYQYDADKERTRKVSLTQAGAKAWERIYLGGMEIYRRYGAGGVVVEETETHHVVDGDHRILLVEDVITTDRANAPVGPLYRYQYSNHLGSSCLELDAGAAVITYEEFHPYGTTAYRSARNTIDATKRYRFTGMERDEESGLGYHTARYYVPWLGRWSSPDPAGLGDGVNRYSYCHGNPIAHADRGGHEAQPVIEKPKAARDATTNDYLANPAGAVHALIEGITWNTWLAGTPRGQPLHFLRGNIIDRLSGNNLGLYQRLVDRRVGNTIEQVKSFMSSSANAAQRIQRVAVSATRDAAEYIRELPRAQRLARLLPRARIVMPSWAPRALERAAETALATAGRARQAYRALPRFALPPAVTRGIPGAIGVAARTLQRIAVPLMVGGLARGIYRGDKLAIADNSIGLVPVALQVVSRVGIAAPVASVVARASAVTAAFSVGWTIGRVVDEHVLSEETRTNIGGAMNEIVNNDGWKEIVHNP
ncbi:MAG: RHS repeat-associated core domain-containing protein, partial [Kofleriaceae bacterium]